MTHHTSPLRYPGGKSCLFSFLSSLLVENDLVGIKYGEPYAGGAGLALKLLFHGYVDQIILNDLDISVYSFWKTILEDADDFCEWISDVEVDIQSWLHFRDIYKNHDPSDTRELAKAAFFLNRTNISGVLQGGVIGGLSQDGTYKINARFNKKELIERIGKIQKYRDQITVTNFDGLEFLRKMNYRKDPVFLCIDPPYYQKGHQLYLNFYNDQDHEHLSKQVAELRKKYWVVTYDVHPYITALYHKNKIVKYQLAQSTSNRIGYEILVLPQSLRFDVSIGHLKDYKFVSDQRDEILSDRSEKPRTSD